MLDSAQSILTLFVGPVGASRLVTTKGIDGWWLFLVVNILVAISYIFQNTLVLSSAKQISIYFEHCTTESQVCVSLLLLFEWIDFI